MKDNEPGTNVKMEKFLDPTAPKPPADNLDETISGLVMEAVEQAATDPGTKSGPPPPPKSLLGLLTYCYAKGIYASGEIADRLQANREARQKAGDALPDANTLRRFRRYNRDVLQSALEKALRLIRRAAIRRTMSQTLPGSAPTSVSKLAAKEPSLTAPGDGTTIMMRREAERKIENAAIIDTQDD